LWQSLGQVGGVAAVRASLGHLYLNKGAITEGVSALTRSLEELLRQDTGLGMASAVCGIASLSHMSGSPEFAAHLLGATEGLLSRRAQARSPLSCIRLKTALVGISSIATLRTSANCARHSKRAWGPRLRTPMSRGGV
jgi:hypothetical protein